jgi:hypothetical protein
LLIVENSSVQVEPTEVMAAGLPSRQAASTRQDIATRQQRPAVGSRIDVNARHRSELQLAPLARR